MTETLGATRHERTEERAGYRNGYRPRTLYTRVGPVTLLVPAPAGGTMDIVARILAESIAAEIGQPVIVENKPGAGGAIAVAALNAAPSDGQTIMVTASNILTEIPLVMKTSFVPVRDVKPVTMVGRANMVLVAAASVPARTRHT